MGPQGPHAPSNLGKGGNNNSTTYQGVVQLAARRTRQLLQCARLDHPLHLHLGQRFRPLHRHRCTLKYWPARHESFRVLVVESGKSSTLGRPEASF